MTPRRSTRRLAWRCPRSSGASSLEPPPRTLPGRSRSTARHALRVLGEQLRGRPRRVGVVVAPHDAVPVVVGVEGAVVDAGGKQPELVAGPVALHLRRPGAVAGVPR